MVLSKTLRAFLLSLLVVAIAVVPSMADDALLKISFDWTGAGGNNDWNTAGNWNVYSKDADNNPVKFVGKLAPGTLSADNTKYSADVYFNKAGARVTFDDTTSSISYINNIIISKDVSLDMGTVGRFANTPSIDIQVSTATLEIKSARSNVINSAFTLNRKKGVTWGGKGNLIVGTNVDFVEGTLTINVDGTLTVNKPQGNGFSVLKSTDITVGKALVLNDTPPIAKGTLKLTFKDGAKFDVPSDITIRPNSGDSAVAVIYGAFTKVGEGNLTLVNNVTKGKPFVDEKINNIAVRAGTLTLGANAIEHKNLTIAVSKDATLSVETKAISADKVDVKLVVYGTANIADNGITTPSLLYIGGKMKLDSVKLSADVKSDGALTFSGTQAITGLVGAGTVTVDGGQLIISVDVNDENEIVSADVNNFTGTVTADALGITQLWPTLPFTKAEKADVKDIYVYGDASILLNGEELDDLDTTNIYLKNNYVYATAKGNMSYPLELGTVGTLVVSGDVALNTITVDGVTVADNVGTIEFEDNATLKANKLVLHANKAQDIDGTTYVRARAVAIEGDGTFTPAAIENNSTAENLAYANGSIRVDGATLELATSVPSNESILITGDGVLSIADNASIPGDLFMNSGAGYKLTVTEDNNYSTGDFAFTVGGTLTMADKISYDIDLKDDNQERGKRYKLIGYAKRSVAAVSENATDLMTITSDDKGIYGALVKLSQKPLLGSVWSVDVNQPGDLETNFTATLSYDIPAKLGPAELINALQATINVDGTEVAAKIMTGTTKTLTYTSGKVMLDTVEMDSATKLITLTGRFYNSADITTKVALDWKTVKGTNSVESYDITYDGAKNVVRSTDLQPLEAVEITLKNSAADKDAGDDTDELDESENVEITTDSAVFNPASQDELIKLNVKGLYASTTTVEESIPTLVNGVYVWNNKYDTTKTYYMLPSEGEAVAVDPIALIVKVGDTEKTIAGANFIISEDETSATSSIVSVKTSELVSATVAGGTQVEITIKGTTPAGTKDIVARTTLTASAKNVKEDVAGEATVDSEGAYEVDIDLEVTEDDAIGEVSKWTIDGNEDGLWELTDEDGDMNTLVLADGKTLTAGTQYKVTVIATGSEGTKEFTVTITVPAAAVTFTGVTKTFAATATVGTEYTATFTAQPTGAKATWAINGTLPVWLTSADTETSLTLRGTPEEAGGPYTFKVVATGSDDAKAVDSVDVSITVAAPSFSVEGEEETGDQIEGFNYRYVATAKNASGKVEWSYKTENDDGDEIDFTLPTWLKARTSGTNDEVLTLEGILPAYVEDADDISFVIVGTVGTTSARTDDVDISIEENDYTKPATLAAIGAKTGYTVTAPADTTKVGTDYDVKITFPTDDGTLTVDFDLDDVNLPSWLEATGIFADGADPETDDPIGIEIKYKAPAGDVPVGTKGVVNIVAADDDETFDLITWEVEYNVEAATPFEISIVGDTTKDITLNQTATFTLTGADTFSADVSGSAGGTVTFNGPTAIYTPAAVGTATITFRGYDANDNVSSNRPTATVNVTSGGTGPVVGALTATATRSGSGSVAVGTPVTINLAATKGGTAYTDVTYSYTISPTTGATVTIASSNTSATFTGTEAETYTVTFKATDNQDATVSADATPIVITVTSGGSTGGDVVDIEEPTVDVDDEETVSDIQDALNVGDNTPVVELSDETATIGGERTASTTEYNAATQTLVATLPEITPNASQIYVFRVDLSRAVPGRLLRWHARVKGSSGTTESLTAAAAYGDAIFMDKDGNTITEVPATDKDKINVAAYLEEGKTYEAVVTTEEKPTGSVGSSGGGCDAGFGALAMILAAPLFLRKRRS